MKKTKVLMVTLILILIFSSIAQAAELGTRALIAGNSGEDVWQLQELLNKIGYFRVNPTGYFGNITKTSVINFQKDFGLNANGTVTLETIHSLKYQNGVAANSFVYARTLKKGIYGGDVMNLQEVLRRLGFFPGPQEATGYFGTVTEDAVTAFQKSTKITTDGIVTSKVAAALNNALNKGSNGNNSNGSNNTGNQKIHIVQSGDTLWDISKKYSITVAMIQKENSLSSSVIYPGQKLVIPGTSTTPDNKNEGGSNGSGSSSEPTVTYKNYTVKAGDTLWAISREHGLLEHDLYKANGFNANTVLYIGQVIKIPVYNIPVKPTPGPQYGEHLDWWTEAQYVVPFNATFTITDFYTGTSFKAVRTYGANHADCEPLTAADTDKIQELWNAHHASYWAARPIIISINGRKLAASMAAEFHAGVDAYPNGSWVENRSGGYGAGENYDAIKGNKADGHFDIHFLNSTRHSDGKVSPEHQANIKIAAGK